MLKKIILFSIVAGFLFWSFYEGADLPYFYFLTAAVILICGLFFVSENDYLSGSISGIAYCIILFLEWPRIGHQPFFLQNFLCILIGGIWFYFIDYWHAMIVLVDTQKNKVIHDIELLREKYNTRSESLGHLERQVISLSNLFEIAKDFNECLYFDQLIDILEKRVKDEIPFQSLTILLTPQTKDASFLRAMSVGNLSEENKIDRKPNYSEHVLGSLVLKEARVLKCEIEKDIALLDPNLEIRTFPVWAFPLQVEEKIIAVLIVHGGALEDFPKFELLASQLALQVKKISLYETVKELSIIDGLTKTYVRRHFLERFEEELKRAVKRKGVLSVLMLDIDHFKSYNDKFGHLVGDGTLREVAAVIRENVRKVDLVARYGGEEFAIVLPDVGSPTNFETAERIRSAVARKKFRLYDEETQATVSIGVAAFPKDLSSSDAVEFRESLMLELIQKADKALYQAKEEGRNRVVSFGHIQPK